MAYPSINKSLRFTAPRGDLEVVEKDIPAILANELLVKVKAASINPVDVQLWGAGLVAVVAGDKGMGRDFSGTVVAVGKDVKGWAVGDDVFGLLFQIVSLRFNYCVLLLKSNSLVKEPSANTSTSILLQIQLPRNLDASPTSKLHLSLL